MLKLIKKSSNKKLGGCAATYRSGDFSVYGTCPNSCPLKPAHQIGSDSYNEDYLDAVAHAVPRGGVAWTYTHFPEAAKLAKDARLRYEVPGPLTCINNSTDSIEGATASYLEGIPTVVVLPESDSGEELKQIRTGPIRMVRCPAEYSNRTCNDCGGDTPLCARFDRDYVIKFTAHGTKKKFIKLRSENPEVGSGGCYGDSGPVRLQWENTLSSNRGDTVSDAEKLADWVLTLPPGTKLRHHVVGDVG